MVRTTLAFALTVGLGACSGSLEDLRAAEKADALGADGFYFEHLDLKDTCHAFDSLFLKLDGSYVATLNSEAETGTYELADTELSLVPDVGEARTYELEMEDGSILLTSDGCKEVLTEAQAPTTPTTPATPVDPVLDPACAERTGGALVTFEVGHDESGRQRPETLRLWITNAAFIARARELVGAASFPTPMFDRVIAGYDACSGRGWSVDPELASYGDVSIEVCDGTPSYLDDNLATWIDQTVRYCPWGPKVISVEER